MKLQIQLWMLLSIAIISGCHTKKQENVNNHDTIAVLKIDGENWDAEFQGYFIYHFMTDSVFQKERTDPSINNYEYVNYFAGKDYTMHVYFSSEPDYDERLIDEIDHLNQLTVVQNEHMMTYTFTQKEEKWFLTNL